jgi:hypothetical protein
LPKFKGLKKVDTSGYKEIKLIVSVTGLNHEPVTDLVEQDFSIYEEGEFLSIVSLDNAVVRPVLAAVSLDYSGSIIDFKNEIEGATKVFLQTLNLFPDEAAVIKFIGEVQVMQEFTTNFGDLEAAVEAPYTRLGVGTILYDAAYESVNIVSRRLTTDPGFRGAVILLSDAWIPVLPSKQ